MTQAVRLSSEEMLWISATKQDRREGFSDKEILSIRHAYRATGDLHAMAAAIEWTGTLGAFRNRCVKLGIPVGWEDRLKGQGTINEDRMPTSRYNRANIPSCK